jgi:hypothetical protein
MKTIPEKHSFTGKRFLRSSCLPLIVASAVVSSGLIGIGCNDQDGIPAPDYTSSLPTNSTSNLNNSSFPYWPTQIARQGDLLSAQDDIFFSTNYVGIGKFEMYPETLYDPRWLVGQNGFDYYEGHRGGYGDTFEILSKQQGIYGRWAYGGFDELVAFGNWQGKIHETGIRLGDSTARFLEAYPDARQVERGVDDRFLEENVGENLQHLAVDWTERYYPEYRFKALDSLIADIGNGQIRAISIGTRIENY